MESILPSEVARLVYGYLEDEGCISAAQAFLETSLHLQECLGVVKKGRKFSTRIMGRSLIQILDLLCEISVIVNEISDSISWSTQGYDKIHDVIKLLKLNNSPRKCQTASASSGNITSTSMVDESPSEIPGDTSKRKEDGIGTVVRENKALHVRLPEDINETIECGRDHDEGSKEDGSSAAETFKADNEDQKLHSEQINGDLTSQRQESLGIVGGITNNTPGGTSGEAITESLNPSVRLLAAIKPEMEPAQLAAQPAEQLALAAAHPTGMVVGPQNILSVQPTQWSNMLHMYQPAAAISQTSMSAVYMQTTVPASQHNQVIFRHENLPAIVSSTPSSITQPATAWSKPQGKIQAKRPTGSTTESKCTSHILYAQKKHKPNLGRPTPKLRPIAPKITQVLENGIEVQVMHTKENPLVDLQETIAPIRRCLRSRPSDTPPPSPLFVDIQDIENNQKN